MLLFKFECEKQDGYLVSGTSLGNLTVIGQDANITSRAKSDFFLIISLTQLLDGIRYFLRIERSSTYHFYSVGSSFGIKFTKSKANKITIFSEGVTIPGIAENEMIVSLFSGVEHFVTRYKLDLKNIDNDALDTPTIALADFKNAISDYQSEFENTYFEGRNLAIILG